MDKFLINVWNEVSTTFIQNPAAQIIGFLSLVFALLSFQQRSRFRILLFQMTASFLYSLQYFLIGAIVGGCLDLVSFGRTLVFSQRDKRRWACSPFILIGFMVAMLVIGILTGFIGQSIGTGAYAWSDSLGWINALAICGSLLSTLALWMRDERLIRRISLLVGPCWIIYNFIVGSYFGVLSETIAMCSIITGIIRYDLKKSK